MAGGAKVRLVRCPKCEKLLPELPEYSLYRCGACGATLQAKNTIHPTTETLCEVSDEERIRVRENPEGLSKENSLLPMGAEAHHEIDTVELRTENISADRNDNLPSNSPLVSGGRSQRPSRTPADNCMASNNLESCSDELTKPKPDQDRKMKARVENSNEFHKFRQLPDWRSMERDEISALRRTPRAVAEGVDFSRYPDIGPSKYHHDPARRYDEPVKSQYPDGFERVHHLQQDRKELLRKLDELRDQLSRSCNVSENPKEKDQANRRIVPPNSYDENKYAPFQCSSLASNRVSSQLFQPDNWRPAFYKNEPVPLMNRQSHNRYPSIQAPSEMFGYGDLNVFGGAQTHGRAPHQSQQFLQRTSKDILHAPYMGVDVDPLSLYPHNTFYDHQACSCLNCHNKHWQVPAQVPAPLFCNSQLPTSAANRMVYHVEKPSTFVPGYYDYRSSNAPLRANEHVPLWRNPSDLESEMVDGGFGRSVPRRDVATKGKSRICQPIAGGAPFITCYNCFELLQLPKKILLAKKNYHKLCCGACSQLILFALDGKKVVFSYPTQTKHIPSGISNDSSELMKVDGVNSHVEESILNGSDGDCDSFKDVRLISSSPIRNNHVTPKEHMLNLSGSDKLRGLSSSSLSSEEILDSNVTERNGPNLDPNFSSSVAGSPLHEPPEYSPTNQVVMKYGNGNRSKRLEQEKIILTKGTSRQNSVKDVSVATEMECSFNGYSNSGISQESGEVSKEDRPRFSKGGDSFFAGLIKKSFRDFGRSNQLLDNGKSSVWINGQPIPDRAVRKAEKQAGSIRPGQYWYDYRSGFWGVMGYQCLGIIPPFIEEFNFPLPKNCSGGNSGVFVNGRELHVKDLELLVRRGLPATKGKSYIVEISGRVLDEASGEELDSLGKLAPTIEKVKHGFGMRVPRAMA